MHNGEAELINELPDSAEVAAWRDLRRNSGGRCCDFQGLARLIWIGSARLGLIRTGPKSPMETRRVQAVSRRTRQLVTAACSVLAEDGHHHWRPCAVNWRPG
jgi:hypothetical protein